MSSKKFVLHFIKFFSLCYVALFAIFTLLYIYDPLQFFHKPWFRETTFSRDMRLQNLGIIRHYDFDSVILGTSMVENISAIEANQKLGGKFVNLSMSGSKFNVRAIVLNYLLKTKKVNQIIYSLDLYHQPDLNDEKNTKPLYEKSYFGAISFYLNKKYIKCALQFSLKDECVGGGGGG